MTGNSNLMENLMDETKSLKSQGLKCLNLKHSSGYRNQKCLEIRQEFFRKYKI